MAVRPHSMSAALLLAALFVAGCTPKSPADRLGDQAAQFILLGTSLGHSKAAEVDAYFGPPKLDRRADDKAPAPAELLTKAKALQAEIGKESGGPDEPRRRKLADELQHFIALLESITATTPQPFAEEALRLYGIVIPPPDEAAVKAQLQQLGELLPGPGSLAFRVASYRNRFIVASDKRQKLFERALEECRNRTLQHWKLPANDQLKVEWSRDVPAAWHRYEGKGQGRLQVNSAAIAYMGTALDLACHEGYPGHQAQFLLMEAAARPGGLPVEDTLVLLRTPVSVLREGAANYAVDLAFTPQERLAFERDVLFPMAGFPAAEAEKYFIVHRLINELALTVLPILRDYRDSAMSFNSATFKLEADALISSPAALLKFVDDYGAYVLGYTIARDRVRDFVTSTSAASGADKWAVLQDLLTNPQISRINPPSATEAPPPVAVTP